MPKTASPKSPKKTKFTKAVYLKWYEDMLLMRRFEEKAGQLYIQQKFGGFCHLYIGQEAVVAGAVSATKKGDKHINIYKLDNANKFLSVMKSNPIKRLKSHWFR